MGVLQSHPMEIGERILPHPRCSLPLLFDFSLGMYIRGLLKFHRIREALSEYNKYNRYHHVNNMINTLVLEGLFEAGFPADCLVLFVTLLLDVQFDLNPNNLVEVDGEQLINWTKNLTNASLGVSMDSRTNFFDPDTKKRLFASRSSTVSTVSTVSMESGEKERERESEEEEPVRLRMRKDDAIGSYLALNKRAYEYAISSACKLKNFEYATMLYSILTSNRVRPRKNAMFSMLSVCL